MSGLRITLEAADDLRAAIRETGGMEVFALGDVQDGSVIAVTIAARGQEERVLAAVDRPRPGQVVIHNHPSGDLRPSDADMSIAARFADDGVGFVIVNQSVTRSNWVVEPARDRRIPVSPQSVREVFEETFPTILPGHEPRQAQIDMALAVAAALTDNRALLCEAGTGTGKSLAYLVPSALWARANEGRVVIATHTRTLQAQIVASDAPLLLRAGLDVGVAVMEGRSNYVCRRRAALAEDDIDTLDEDRRGELRALLDWAAGSGTGSRSELHLRAAGDLWERIESDSDLTLRHRCEHYETCHYYSARRKANEARIVVVNHALLLADLTIRHSGGGGILPKYDRIILDEAQHLEDVATGAMSSRVSQLAVQRALSGLVGRASKGGGALSRLGFALEGSNLPREMVDNALKAASEARGLCTAAPLAISGAFDTLSAVIDPQTPVRRIEGSYTQSDEWTGTIAPQSAYLATTIDQITGMLDAINGALGDERLPESRAQALLDVNRARRRLNQHSASLRAFLAQEEARCRWIEASRDGQIALCTAPVDVAASLKAVLWEVVPGTVGTSATLSVAGDFSFFLKRTGLEEARSAVYPSPFDHFRQAMLGIPTDLVAPDDPSFLHATSKAIAEAVLISGGGAFVLCTSFKAVDHYATVLRKALPAHIPVLAQGEAARNLLLARFREHHDAVLVGTDSFWEGVNVRGDGLRLVIVPRLPFRVPTEPLQQARHERLERAGQDPFRALTLPQAVLKLRQGYGRLIRSTTDRGVVLLLDRRVHDKAYGRVVLASLPPARRLSAPWARISQEMKRFFEQMMPQLRRGDPGEP